MNDWTARSIDIPLDFLDEGAYQADVFADGPNADRIGNDYTRTIRAVKKGETITVQLAPGGGWTARLMPGKPTE